VRLVDHQQDLVAVAKLDKTGQVGEIPSML
jgi:hypothetical protein